MELDLVLLVSRWTHIASAIVAIGGAMFLRFVLVPSAERQLTDEDHERLRDAVRVRWARVVHICIALLLVSGSYNFFALAIRPSIEPMPYHAIFVIKLLAALVLFLVSAALVGTAPGFSKMRQRSRRWQSFILLLAALIVLLSGMLGQVRTRPGTQSAPSIRAIES